MIKQNSLKCWHCGNWLTEEERIKHGQSVNQASSEANSAPIRLDSSTVKYVGSSNEKGRTINKKAITIIAIVAIVIIGIIVGVIAAMNHNNNAPSYTSAPVVDSVNNSTDQPATTEPSTESTNTSSSADEEPTTEYPETDESYSSQDQNTDGYEGGDNANAGTDGSVEDDYTEGY